MLKILLLSTFVFAHSDVKLELANNGCLSLNDTASFTATFGDEVFIFSESCQNILTANFMTSEMISCRVVSGMCFGLGEKSHIDLSCENGASALLWFSCPATP